MDLVVRRLEGTRVGAVVRAVLDAFGVSRTSMVVYAVPLETADVGGEPPEDVTVDVVRASELSVKLSDEFDDVEPWDFVAVARDVDAPPAERLAATDVDAVRGWVFLTLERPVTVTELAATVRFDGAYVWGLYVDPSHRRRGVASTLLARALAFAEADRVTAAYALVASDNAPSRRTFEARGFEVVDEVTYYRVLDWGYRAGSLRGEREYGL